MLCTRIVNLLLGRAGRQHSVEDIWLPLPDHHSLIAFKFGDEFVPAEDLRFVEGPEPAHHFDAAFGWIRHLGRRQGEGAGMGGGPGLGTTREEAANRTALGEAASCSLQLSFSAGHRELGGLGSSGRSETG